MRDRMIFRRTKLCVCALIVFGGGLVLGAPRGFSAKKETRRLAGEFTEEGSEFKVSASYPFGLARAVIVFAEKRLEKASKEESGELEELILAIYSKLFLFVHTTTFVDQLESRA